MREEVLALGPRALSCAGLSVLLRQGMEDWMNVVSFSRATSPPPAPTPRNGVLAGELPDGLAGAIVAHLTQMLLAHAEAS